MKKTFLMMVVCGLLAFSCSDKVKDDPAMKEDTTNVDRHSGPAMQPGDRTSDGGH